MDEKKETILYRVFNGIFFVLALAGTVLLFLNALWQSGGFEDISDAFFWVVSAALLAFILFPLSVVLHEAGHLLFGFMVGLRPAYVQIGNLAFQKGKVSVVLRRRADGVSAMYARTPEGLRTKLVFAALGGAIFNYIYGIVFLVLGILFPTPAVLFFSLFAPLNLYEGLLATLPARLPAGATDGAVVKGLLKKQPFAEVMLAVMKTQAALYTQTYAQIPRDWLFELPVLREDDRSFAALLQLRWQWQFCNGEEEGALATLERLDEVYEYTPEPDLACDLAYANVVFFTCPDKALDYLDRAAPAKGKVAYARAALACGQGDFDAGTAIALAEREQFKGLKDLEFRLIERIPHMI